MKQYSPQEMLYLIAAATARSHERTREITARRMLPIVANEGQLFKDGLLTHAANAKGVPDPQSVVITQAGRETIAAGLPGAIAETTRLLSRAVAGDPAREHLAMVLQRLQGAGRLAPEPESPLDDEVAGDDEDSAPTPARRSRSPSRGGRRA